MSGDNDNPRIWLGANVYVADLETTLPTTIDETIDAGFELLGWLSEDGLTEAIDQTITHHRAWGATGPIRSQRSKIMRTFTVTALEENALVLSLAYPGSTFESTLGETTVTLGNPVPDPRSFIFELTDGDITRRIVIPRAEVMFDAELSYKEDGVTVYPLPVTVYDGDEPAYFITDNPAVVTAS